MTLGAVAAVFTLLDEGLDPVFDAVEARPSRTAVYLF